jgi:predicted site-specific integrase-resolvase
MVHTYSPAAFSDLVGCCVKTLQRWDRDDVLKASRTPTGRRFYTDADLRKVRGLPETSRVAVVYCRVSSAAQKPDLANQRKVLEEFCAARGFAEVEFVEEVGGGLNFKRKRFLEIMERIGRGEVNRLILAHKDRLVRFGFDWFEHYCETSGCEILVLNAQTLSPQEEMVQDLMTIVHCFSSRLYGLRNYKKKLKEVLEQDKKAVVP